jgi:hypothetical protein
MLIGAHSSVKSAHELNDTGMPDHHDSWQVSIDRNTLMHATGVREACAGRWRTHRATRLMSRWNASSCCAMTCCVV